MKAIAFMPIEITLTGISRLFGVVYMVFGIFALPILLFGIMATRHVFKGIRTYPNLQDFPNGDLWFWSALFSLVIGIILLCAMLMMVL